MSRKAALLIVAPVPIWLVPIWPVAPAVAQALTAEEAQDNYRRTFNIADAAPACESPDGAIIVCGKRDDTRHRLPLPAQPTPGGKLRGDVPNASAERGQAGTERCTTVGPSQQCGGGLPVIPMAVTAVKALVKLAEGDD